MLETLNEIKWQYLRHAYYNDEANLPELLRGLLDTDPKVRSYSISMLEGSIAHQGTLYNATGYVVPFLFELLAGEEVPDKDKILNLVLAISIGYYYKGYRPKKNAQTYITEHLKELDHFLDSPNPMMQKIAIGIFTSSSQKKNRKQLFERFDQLYQQTQSEETKLHLLIGKLIFHPLKKDIKESLHLFQNTESIEIKIAVACTLLNLELVQNEDELIEWLMLYFLNEKQAFKKLIGMWDHHWFHQKLHFQLFKILIHLDSETLKKHIHLLEEKTAFIHNHNAHNAYMKFCHFYPIWIKAHFLEGFSFTPKNDKQLQIIQTFKTYIERMDTNRIMINRPEVYLIKDNYFPVSDEVKMYAEKLALEKYERKKEWLKHNKPPYDLPPYNGLPF